MKWIIGWWGRLFEGDEGPERDELLILNAAREGLSYTCNRLGLKDIDCLYASCDSPSGRLRIEFDGWHGKAFRVTVDDADGHTTHLIPEHERVLVSFSIYEELDSLFQETDLGDPLADEGWREALDDNGRKRNFVYLRTLDDEDVVFCPPEPAGLERFCMLVQDLFLAGSPRNDSHLCVIHFPQRYAGRTALGFAEEVFEVVYNGPTPWELRSFSWKEYDLVVGASGLSSGIMVDLRGKYRETGYAISELEPVLMKPEERFWFPLDLCDGMQEHWDIITSAHDIDPMDWVEGFERAGEGIYRCTEIDRLNTELLESYPFRG